MLHIFSYNSSTNEVNVEDGNIFLIREFQALMNDKRNVCKEDKTGKKHLRAFRELTYIWLAIDWDSLYKNYTPQERHEEAFKDAKLTEEEWNDPIFREACRKYRDLQNSNPGIRLLEAQRKMVHRITDYFDTVDPLERDENTGKPIYKVKDLEAEMANSVDLLDTLKQVEDRVKKEMKEESSIKGGAIEGFRYTGE